MASYKALMTNETIPLLKSAALQLRVSSATRAALEARAHPVPYPQFLDDESLALLRSLVSAILPQDTLGTRVDIAEGIDRRLAEGKNNGWRFAALPPDGQAYREGLATVRKTMATNPGGTFEQMSIAARESYLRRVANGDEDDASGFPLSTFFTMLRGDIVRLWMSHPDTMSALELYSFATGVSGRTDGPTPTEGWQELTPNTALPFEHGAVALEREA